MWIARNYTRRGDLSYVVCLEEPRALVSPDGEVSFQHDCRPAWTTYIKAHNWAQFEALYPHLKLRPGEGPYRVSESVERPRDAAGEVSKFAGVAAASMSEVAARMKSAQGGAP